MRRNILPILLLLALLLFPPTIGVTPHTTQMDVPQAQIALVNDQVTVTSEQASLSLTIADYDVRFSIGTPVPAKDLGEMLEAIHQALEWWFRRLSWDSGGWHGW